MAGFQLAGPAADVSKFLYGESRKLYGEPKRAVPLLDITLYAWAPHTISDVHHTKFKHICSRTCLLRSSHRGTKIAITFPTFTFRRWFLSQIV